MRRYRLCLRAFPRDWRALYGAEVLELLAEGPARRWDSLDLLRTGVRERWRRLWADERDTECSRRASSKRWLTRAGIAVGPACALTVVLGSVLQEGAPGSRSSLARRGLAPTPIAAVRHSAASRQKAAIIAGQARRAAAVQHGRTTTRMRGATVATGHTAVHVSSAGVGTAVTPVSRVS